MISKIRDIEPEKVFLIIGLIFGISILFINPPHEVPDEPTHYNKTAELAKGQIYFGKSINFIDLYSPIPYLIPTSAILTGKILNLPNSVIFYLGRMFNLIFFIGITYLAIKLTPVLKWVFLLLGLMPMSLYEAASFSSDGFNIVISFLLIALIFKFAFDDKKININQKDIIIVFLLGMLLALSKQVYVLLLLLFFLIPSTKFESRRKMFINFFSIILSCFLIMMGWQLFNQVIFVPISAQISPQGQILFILSHPLAFIIAYINSIIQNLSYYLITFVGTFGWLDNALDTPLPNSMIYAYIIVLFLASLLDNSDINITFNQKLISLFTFLLTSTSIFTVEYLLWTVVGANKIDGVIGRYFIPIAPLFFLMLCKNRHMPDIKGKKFVLIFFVIVFLSISIFIIFKRFYTT